MIYKGSYNKETRLKMIVILMEGNSLDSIHDVLCECYDTFYDLDDTQKNIIYLNLLLECPDELLGLAYSWGTSDTVFRDNLYSFIDDNREELSEIIKIS